MKFFIAIALIATVASAAIIKPRAVSAELAEIQEIIAAINSPSTNPATAAALQDMLLDILGVSPEPIAVGPAIVESVQEPISVGPALVETEFEPIAVGPALVETEFEPIAVGPAIVDFPVPAPSPVADVASAPLVQIIVNINQAAAESTPIAPSPIAPAPVVIPEADKPEPIHVVETAPEIIETAPIAVNPIGVVETGPVPIQVIETAPVAVEPVVIGTPILPAPAVVLPETLN